MSLILGLIGYAAVAVLTAPLLLTHGQWRLFHPVAALRAWLIALLSGLVSLALVVLSTVALALDYDQTRGHHANGFEATVVVVAAWGLLGAVGAALALVLTHAEPLNDGSKRTYEQLAMIAALAPHRVEGGVEEIPVVFIESQTPIATGIPGPAPQIVISSAIERGFAPAALRAVIAHERAHLRLGHARFAQLSHLNAVCLPWLGAAREFEHATQLLIELIADDEAVRECGAPAVIQALGALPSSAHAEGMLLRARRVGVLERRRSALHGSWLLHD